MCSNRTDVRTYQHAIVAASDIATLGCIGLLMLTTPIACLRKAMSVVDIGTFPITSRVGWSVDTRHYVELDSSNWGRRGRNLKLRNSFSSLDSSRRHGSASNIQQTRRQSVEKWSSNRGPRCGETVAFPALHRAFQPLSFEDSLLVFSLATTPLS